MSRRYTSGLDRHTLSRMGGTALGLLLLVGLASPPSVGAQEAGISDQDIAWEWQLLNYRDASGSLQPAPAGVGATLQLFAQSAFGEAACSTFEGSYTRGGESLFIDIDPATGIERVACDPASEAFDEDFYQNLVDTESVRVSDSIMSLRSSDGELLMTLTRAVIDDDPTVARWELARLGAADGAIEPVIPGLDPWIEFLRGGRLVGETGCGSFLGSYQVNSGSMSISDVAYRLGSCTESVRRQAQQMVTAFEDITDFSVLPAGLALRDEAGTIRLALAPAIELAARTWTPVVIFGPDGQPFDDDAVEMERLLSTSAVKFQGRSAEGSTICRLFDANSLSSGLALSVSAPTLEGEPCPKKRQQDVESAFISALQATSSQALRGSELELRDVDGATLMRLKPQAELTGVTWVVAKLNRTPAGSNVSRISPVADTTISATFEAFEVVRGDTGAADRQGPNDYFAEYRTPKATRIEIEDVAVEGKACSTAKQQARPACRQEALYKDLLEQADRFIVQEDQLRLFAGQTPLLWFAPEAIEAPAP